MYKSMNKTVSMLSILLLAVVGMSQAAAPVGDTVWLYSVSTDSYVTMDPSKGNWLAAKNVSTVGTNEQFVVEDAGSGNILLKSVVNSNYVKVDLDDANKLKANTTSNTDTLAHFEWIELGDGKIRLKNIGNGLNIRPRGGALVLRANTTATEIETEFTWGIVVIMPDPVSASNPSPPDGDIIVTSPDDVVLGWTSEINGASHDVYFGSNFDDVNNGTGGTFKASLPLDVNSFDPGDLEFDRTYYWRIDEVKGPTTWPGDVWSFETAVEFGSRVDCNTLTSKIMAGYQGWFNCPTDGANLGWTHWGKAGKFEPGYCSVDMWPDMSEYDEDEKYATLFQHADGSTAYVFSSHNRKTVMRHWKWMHDYGIDGGFVQRFASGTKNSKKAGHKNVVLSHCRDGAERYGRTYALMYDLSGLGYGEIKTVLIEDFKKLVDQLDLLNSDAYLYHNGRPVVTIWGMGFKDRAYTPAECDELVDFLKNDPTYGGCSVMLGVPSFWRTLTRDCISDPMIHDVILKADIVSPWSVGRFGMSGINDYDSDVWEPDMAWCAANNLDYLPVVWPGFSWYNLKYPDAPFDSHPRYGGQFLWKQLIEAKKSGATMLYQAMFDEVDEATAIFKCTNDPPVGESLFLADPSLPTDHYLWLSAQGGRLLRGEIEPTSQMPTRY